MRKSAKILALTLLIVLLAGTVATSVFASDSAEPVHPDILLENVDGVFSSDDYTSWDARTDNFEGDTYEVFGATSIATGKMKQLTLSYKNKKFGALKTVPVMSGDKVVNTYLRAYHSGTATTTTSTSTSSHFIQWYTGDGDCDTAMNLATSYDNIKPTSYIKNDFIVIDFDLTADQYIDANGNLVDPATIPAGTDLSQYKVSYNSNLAITLRSCYQATHQQHKLFFYDTKEGFRLNIDNPANGTALLSNVPGQWNHVTLIYEVDNRVDFTYSGGTVVAGTVADCIAKGGTITKTYISNTKIHAYLDGVRFTTLNFFTSEDVNTPDYPVSPYDIQFLPGTVDKNFSYGIDNLTAHYYADGYEGAMADAFAEGAPAKLGACSDMVYNYDYRYSAPNTPVASIAANGKVKNYYSLDGALANITEGATLTLADGQTVTNYTPTCNFDVVCAEGAFTITEGTEYSVIPTETGVSIRKYDVTVNWFCTDGTEYGTSKTFAGTAPADAPTEIASYREEGNKFYYLNWSGKWHNGSADGAIVEDLAALSAGEYNLYADMTVPVLDIDNSLIMFNYAVATRFEKFYYLPYMSGDDFLYNTISYSGVNGGDLTYGNVKYAKVILDFGCSPISNNSLRSNTVTINATINGVKLTQDISVPSLPTYIKSVLDNSNDYYAKKLCINIARYCDEVYDYTREYLIANGKSTSLSATSPYEAYFTGDYATGDFAGMLIDTASNEFNNKIAADAKTDVKPLLDYIEGATYYLGSTGIPNVAFVPKTLAEGETLPGGVTIANIFYSYNGFKGEGTTIAYPKYYSDVNAYYYKNINEKIYFYSNNLKVEVVIEDKDGNKETLVGTYNLAGYIQGLNGKVHDATKKDASIDVAKAMYAYSMAAIEYLTTEEGAAAPKN